MLIVKYLLAALMFTSVATGNGPCSYATRKSNTEGTNGIVYMSVRYGHYIALDCCHDDGNEVHWQKWNKNLTMWQSNFPTRNEVRFLDNKQILTIQSSEFEDSGLYMCSVQNTSSIFDNRTFQLQVVVCDKLARGPYPISPLPCSETITRETEILTLPCTGYFGCEEEGDIRIITWYVSLDKNKESDWKEASSVDNRYKQTYFQQNSGAVMGSNLTIKGVLSRDFNRKFMCVLATPQTIKGQSQIIVTLRRYSINDESSLLQPGLNSEKAIIIVTCVAVVSLIVNIGWFAKAIYEGLRKERKTHIKRRLEQNCVSEHLPDDEKTGMMIKLS